ncbi:hypothetical protein [Limibacillus halophilus]|uniref:Uncharacterized protein n=1 Tax=Limibacillus halophilus TaxID=1579333 RepID=A0A839SXX4_9PROT|nr:hypothetical protein [Limibacillus halophilus]MBB3066474.1 hypothetical protein [Limibacillus halophilus]
MKITGFTLDETGERNSFCFVLRQPDAEDGVSAYGLIDCQPYTGEIPMRVIGTSNAHRLALACCFLREVLRGKTLFDEAGERFPLPKPQDFEPDWPSEEEVAELVVKTNDFGRGL